MNGIAKNFKPAPTVALLTLGCKVNQSETSLIEKQLRQYGFGVVHFREYADIYIINTCSVTSRTDRKSREYIRSLLRRNSSAKIIVTGCYAQRDKRGIESISSRVTVFPNKDKNSIADYINRRYGKLIAARMETAVGDGNNGRTRAFVKIQDGCRRFCKYCIIPYVRREIYSKPAKEVIDEVESLVAEGFREVVVCGINFGYYDNLPGLIEELHSIRGLDRIRISSIEPVDVSSRLIKLISDLPGICRHLHIPLQSGSDRVLELMGRKYTSGDFKTLVGKIRNSIPGIAITTDIIVGFPGETDNDFTRTYGFAGDMGFSKIHVFRYSPRPETEAAGMKNKVPEFVKKERSKRLLELEVRQRMEFWKKHMKKTLNVLLEKKARSPEMGVFFSGLSDNYIRVAARGKADVNSIVRVKVNALGRDCVIGEILN